MVKLFLARITLVQLPFNFVHLAAFCLLLLEKYCIVSMFSAV